MKLLSDLNWGFLEILFLVIVFLVGILSTYYLLPYIIKLMKKVAPRGLSSHYPTFTVALSKTKSCACGTTNAKSSWHLNPGPLSGSLGSSRYPCLTGISVSHPKKERALYQAKPRGHQ